MAPVGLFGLLDMWLDWRLCQNSVALVVLYNDELRVRFYQAFQLFDVKLPFVLLSSFP